jgi:hypothetical protein
MKITEYEDLEVDEEEGCEAPKWQDNDVNDADMVFNYAIKKGRLSKDPKADNYFGNYMYMNTENGKDLFKHYDTRQYID